MSRGFTVSRVTTTEYETTGIHKKTFNPGEESRSPNEQGKILNAGLQIDDSFLILMDEFREFGGQENGVVFGSRHTNHSHGLKLRADTQN